MNIKERIVDLKEKQKRQKDKLSLQHGVALLELYNTCEHMDSRRYNRGYDTLECIICGYTRRVEKESIPYE